MLKHEASIAEQPKEVPAATCTRKSLQPKLEPQVAMCAEVRFLRVHARACMCTCTAAAAWQRYKVYTQDRWG